MPQTSTTQTYINDSIKAGNEVLTFFKSGDHLMLAGCITALVVLSVLGGGNKKSKLARGRSGGMKEKRASREIALKQIQAGKKKPVALYINKPRQTRFGTKDAHTLYFPDANRGMAACGGNGSGKTYSFINPLLRSAIDQGFSTILFDFKYPSQDGVNEGDSQTEQIVGYAERAGFDIHFFCPGFKESEVCNPLDFLEARNGLGAEADAGTALQIAEVMNRNFRMHSTDKEDPFFGPAGDQLVSAIIMLAKSSNCPDMMMCRELLKFEDLGERIKSADLDYWVKAAFDQFLSSSKSERTASSIRGTASILFSRLMMPDVMGAVCGKTTLPLDLDRKQLVVFGLDRRRRKAIGPVLAAVLQMLVDRNVSGGRSSPLILSLDELPSLYLPSITNWLAEARSEGLVTILGFQNMGQLEDAYGKKFKTIFGNCAWKAIFNPLEPDSGEYFSKLFGDKEVFYKRKSKGTSGGKSSTNVSEEEKTTRLYEPSFFTTQPEGYLVLTGPGQSSRNPGHQRKEEAFIPIDLKIKIPEADRQAAKASADAWEEIRDDYIARSTQRIPRQSDFSTRQLEAELLIPAVQKQSRSGTP